MGWQSQCAHTHTPGSSVGSSVGFKYTNPWIVVTRLIDFQRDEWPFGGCSLAVKHKHTWTYTHMQCLCICSMCWKIAGSWVVIYASEWTTNGVWLRATISFVVSYIVHVPFNKEDGDHGIPTKQMVVGLFFSHHDHQWSAKQMVD